VTIATRDAALTASRVVQEKVAENEQIDVLTHASPSEFKGDSRLRSVVLKDTETGEEREITPDGVVVLIGLSPNTELGRDVDPVASVAAEAIAAGAQLLVTHHPLYLRGTTTVAATTGKGRLVHELIRSGVALYVAHTNADVADPGVSDALAAALDVRDVTALDPRPGDATDKVVTF